MTPAAIEFKGITKRFGDFYANRDISFSVERGSIHAVVGENGAGKSTLMKVLYGLYRPDAGDLVINGEKRHIASPAHAIELGIGMVHQHFMLVEPLTVVENIILGDEPVKNRVLIDRQRAVVKLFELSEKFGLSISPYETVELLSVGLQQRVEILKLLYRDASILILDEPTAVLTPIETEQLFKTLKSLAKAGNTILIITHKLDEVLRLADTVSVMRQGELIDTRPTAGVTKETLARLMVGRDVLLHVEKNDARPNDEMLSIKNVTYTDIKGVKRLDGLSLSVRAGEIYGIAGVEGNGQSELLKLLWGMPEEGATVSGSIAFSGTAMLGKTPREIAALGVSHVPEDRLKYAVINSFSISDNLIFGRHYERDFLSAVGFNLKKLWTFCAEMLSAFDVRSAKGASPNERIGNLSGGNQQKIVTARELTRPNLKLLILAQPTRGVDIGAIEFIHRKVIEAREKEIAILLISAELSEIISLADRIGCIYRGTIRKEFSQIEVTKGRKTPDEFEKQLGQFIT